jgi:thioredoxin reductase (NADPH)
MSEYDIVIIGGGPAGLTAGLYATRSKMKTLLVEKAAPGGQAVLAWTIENYPGFPEGIDGMELMERTRKQAEKYGLEIKSGEVLKVSFSSKHEQSKGELEKLIKTEQGEYEVIAVIVATGARPRKLGVPGEERLIGRGVSYCATCDGPMFKNREVIVVGGGDAAVEEALFLSRFAEKTTLIYRREELRATKIIQERAISHPKLEFIWNSVVTEILGENEVAGVRVRNLETGKDLTLEAKGVFVYIGTVPNSEFLKGIVEMDEEGFIITDENMETSVSGIYACGDVRKKLLKQVVTACGEGATAGVVAGKYVGKWKYKN